jgi:hypothetical protein
MSSAEDAASFYRDLFRLPVTQTDDQSTSFRCQNAAVTLLDLDALREP